MHCGDNNIQVPNNTHGGGIMVCDYFTVSELGLLGIRRLLCKKQTAIGPQKAQNVIATTDGFCQTFSRHDETSRN